jgi:pimeloyl-ACP methyl ester carboxylesterase
MMARFLLWLSAGALSVGLLIATLAGAGAAVADDGTASNSGKATSSESSNPTVRKHDSRRHKPDSDAPSTKASEDASRKRRAHTPATQTKRDQGDAPGAFTADTTKTVDKRKAAESTASGSDEVAAVLKAPAPTTKAPAPTTKPAVVATTFASAATKAAAANPMTNVINAVGNLAFNVLALVTNLGAGPPVLPPDSTVSVSRSSLQVGSKTVTADWYFPDGDTPPTGLIYFQHGAYAVSSMYSYTAADLADKTNSIVVAPTMSTNGFAPDGMWLGGAPLQTAVADLFEGDRSALTASASAAAGHPVTLPEQFVLAGHSLGGSFVTAVAGYLADDHATDDLEGVVLFDPVASAGQDSLVPDALGKLPADLPVLAIGSPPSFWNDLGSAASALAAARPNQFVGVILDGGSHADSLQGGNPLIQFIENAVSGVPQKRNIAATQMLASGWINDMMRGTHEGIYSSPGDSFTIDTPAGTATADALPDTRHKPSFFQVLLTKLVDLFSAVGNSQG